MPYAQRPMGDYKTFGYAGDPGFLSGLWKGIKKVGKFVAGAALGAVLPIPQPQFQLPAPGKPTRQVAIPGQFGGQVTFPGGLQIGGQFAPGTMVPGRGRLPPFTATGPGVLPGGGRGGAMVPSGYHFAKDGSGRLVRNRRMNVANPKALRRAMRRAQGFEKLARRSINFNKRVRPARRKCT